MQGKPLRGIHVFWMVFAFFAVVIGVDTYFIVGAVTTFPGEQVKNSYVLGLDYNREVERNERQARLGWSATAGLKHEGELKIVIHIQDLDAQPVSGLAVSAAWHVLGQGRDERDLVLHEVKPGQYEAVIDAPGKSRIDVAFAAQRPRENGIVFEAAKTLVVS